MLCQESYSKLYQEYIKGIHQWNPAVLWITGFELRVVEQKSKVNKEIKYLIKIIGIVAV